MNVVKNSIGGKWCKVNRNATDYKRSASEKRKRMKKIVEFDDNV